MKEARPSRRRIRFFLVSILVGYCIWGPLSSAFGAETVGDFLARHRKALGGDKGVENSSSLVMTGTATRGDVSKTFRWTIINPSLFREDLKDDQGLAETVATDGQNVWMMSVNNSDRGVQGCIRSAIKFTGAVVARGYLEPDDIGWTMDGLRETDDGRTRIDARRPDGSTATLFFQGKKPLLVSASTTDPACAINLAFQDYTKHGKTRLPHRIVITRAAAGKPLVTTYQVDAVDTGGDIAPETFDRPDTLPRLARFEEDKAPVLLPMARDDSGRTFVQLRMDDGPTGCWMIDTRAIRSALPRSQIEALKIEPAGVADWWCLDGGTVRYRLPSLTVDGLKIGPVFAALGEDNVGPDETSCGILGADVLRHLVVTLQYSKNLVVFEDPDQFADTGAGDALPLDGFDRAIVLVNGRVVLPVGVATAATSAPVIVPAGGVKTNDIQPPREKRLPLEVGGTVHDNDYLGVLETLQIGGTTLSTLPARFLEVADGRVCGVAPAPVLGARVLERFDVVLDFPHRQVIVERSDRTEMPFALDRSGLALRRNDTAQLVAGRKASNSDIREGDMLVGIKMGKGWSEDPAEIARALEAPAGTVVVLRIRRGKRTFIRKLTLTDP